MIGTLNIAQNDKTQIADRALAKWAKVEGSAAAAVWLSDGNHGSEFDNSRAWLAVDMFAQNPQIATALVAQIEDASLRAAAVMEIAASAKSLQEVSQILSFADVESRARIAASF